MQIAAQIVVARSARLQKSSKSSSFETSHTISALANGSSIVKPRHRTVVLQKSQGGIVWSKRISAYRKSSKLTQERLAELFNVETRTIQRWESGQSMPPKHVQAALRRTPMPAIETPTARGIMSIVEHSTERSLLLDARFIVVAASPSYREVMQRLFNIDILGADFHRFVPASFADAVAKAGGYDAIRQRGYSSMTGDHTGGKSGVNWRVNQCVITPEGYDSLELVFSRPIPVVEHAQPVITYLDEIMQDG
jgi:DNA-binding transcriptional regulator YiaG